MTSLKQLLRQPMKAVFGVILIAIAVAVLCVCLGQSIASKEVEKQLNETYMTAAFAKSNTENKQSTWLSSYAAEHPEVVKSVSQVGLASAYIPELTIDNWTQHWHKPLMSGGNICAPYDTALLEVTLTDISEVPHTQHVKDTLKYCKLFGTNQYTKVPFGYDLSPDSSGDDAAASNESTVEDGLIVYLTGTVEYAVCLQEGYSDPAGYTARITLHLPDQNSLDELNLTIGERYLVYGMNYQDEDWILRHDAAAQMPWNKENKLPHWKLDTFEWMRDAPVYSVDEETGEVTYGIRIFTDDVPMGVIQEITTTNIEDLPLLGFKCQIGDLYHGMDLEEYAKFRSVSITIDGTQQSTVYQQPTIVHLTGSAEEFLTGEDGKLWAEALHNVEVNNHAFAFIGLDKLRYIENFNSGEAKLIQGRDFTDEEVETGAKVCIISRQLADANGLTVGDTIEPRFYEPDLSLGYQLSMSNNTFTPKPLYYFSNTTQLTEAKNYTIVGIYEQNDPTPSLVDISGNMVNPYGFTSNTIFAPKTSMESAMQYSESWMFKTVVLHNGALEEFQLAAVEAGLGENFLYTDNGYSAIESSLLTYSENAKRATIVGAVVYCVTALLYLILFPARQKHTLVTMESLGVERGKRIRHLLSESVCIALTGSILGAILGFLLWKETADLLSEGSSAILDVPIRFWRITGIAAIQNIFILGAVMLLAIPMTRKKPLSKQR